MNEIDSTAAAASSMKLNPPYWADQAGLCGVVFLNTTDSSALYYTVGGVFETIYYFQFQYINS